MSRFPSFAPLRFLISVLLLLLIAVPSSASEPDTIDSRLKHRFEEAARKEANAKAFLRSAEKATSNQALYDVHYYDLDLTLNPTTEILTGTVGTTVTVTGASITTLDLDLWSGLAVSAARCEGIATTFTHTSDILTIDLDRAYTTGENVTVEVDYSGDPSQAPNALGAAFGWDSHNGESMIWTLSEPFGARDWWPCKDLNADKADSVSLRCTVPSHLIVASNGLLLSDTTDGDQRTFHWKTNYPIATYLVSLAIHPYAQASDWYTPLDGGTPMEIAYYVYPDNVSVIDGNYTLTASMIEHFALGYGEYPFVGEKYGHADFVWGGGMEHQTITSLGWWSEDVISHELAHQWWGDMITCADFGHIWLNEGFATWSEAYWAEHRYGFDTYQEYMSIASYWGGGTIFVEDPQTEEIFSGDLSYDKGSWVVHMLRGVLGDDDFFAGLALYRSHHAYGTATTEDLQADLEAVSGLDLSAFFQQWIYGEYFPVYRLTWSDGAASGEIDVTIEQIQTNTGLFTMPVRLRVVTDGDPIDVTVQNSLASETYTLSVGSAVANDVLLDPDHWILRQVETTVSNPSLDQGILLVNGVDWNTYGELPAAYEAKAFWGENPISFWDCFSEPSGGYPSTLPAPLGHGEVPAGVLGDYSTVIWIGNDYNGDLTRWQATPILSYLEAGGNVLLMSRHSSRFLTDGLQDYLGVSFQDIDATLGECRSVAAGLTDIPFSGTQSYNDVYLTAVSPGELLFEDGAAFSPARGVGAWVAPAGGGTHRSDGGRLVHIGARPYRLDTATLRANVEYILSDLLLEPYEPASPVPDLPAAGADRLALEANYPNPFNPRTVIPFRLPQDTEVSLDVYDARGHRVRSLLSGALAAGRHEIAWDGQDNAGRSVATGTYFARLRTAQGRIETRALLLLK